MLMIRARPSTSRKPRGGSPKTVFFKDGPQQIAWFFLNQCAHQQCSPSDGETPDRNLRSVQSRVDGKEFTGCMTKYSEKGSRVSSKSKWLFCSSSAIRVSGILQNPGAHPKIQVRIPPEAYGLHPGFQPFGPWESWHSVLRSLPYHRRSGHGGR